MSRPEDFPHSNSFESSPIDILVAERRNFITALQYADYLGSKRYARSPIADHLVTAASCVERLDPNYGLNPECPAGKAFLYGELVGLRVAEHLLGPDFVTQLLSAPIPLAVNPGESNEFKALRAQRLLILDRAAKGFQSAGQYHQLLAEWQQDISSTEEHGEYVNFGFGFIMFLMQRLEQDEVDMLEVDRAVDQLEQLANIDVDLAAADWDSLLRELPGTTE